MASAFHTPTLSSQQLLDGLRSIGTRQAIEVLRQFNDLELYESYGADTVAKGLDEVIADFWPVETGYVHVIDERCIGASSYLEARS